VSDDRTIRIGPDAPDRKGRSRTAVATAVAVVLAALVLLFFFARAGRDEQEAAGPLASESSEAVTEQTSAPAQPESEPPASDPAASEPAPTPQPTGASERSPTTTDVTAFVDAYEARYGDPVISRIIDVDADGTNEVVAARVADNAAQIDVAAWDGAEYTVVFNDTGGAAERLDDIAVREANQEGGLEIITFQSVGEEGHSISIWGAVPGGSGTRYERQEAVGGCWDGSNTYGIVGATVESGSISATCDGSPLPPELWPSDVYGWSNDAWTYERTVEAQS
jgi:hypothetical protein